MKKRAIAIMMSGIFAMTSLSGCGALYKLVVKTQSNASQETESESAEVSAEQTESSGAVSEEEKESSEAQEESSMEDTNVEPQDTEEVSNKDCVQAFMEFLSGERTVQTTDYFKGDEDGYYYGLQYGSYDYNSLKAAIAEIEGRSSTPYYSMVDFGNDGRMEMALRFECVDSSFLNWTGILTFDGDNLYLTYDYEDGYRSYSTLYTSGYLSLGGSGGAGAHYHEMLMIDKNGVGKSLFRDDCYWGSFATGIIYDIDPENAELENNYEMIYESEMEVYTYIKEGESVKICVTSYSEDAEIRELEEALMAEYVKKGAELISEEEFAALCAVEEYTTEEVEWIRYDDGSALPENTANIDISVVEDPFEEEIYDLYAADEESDFRVNLRIVSDQNMRNVNVVSLNWEDMDETGTSYYSVESEYGLEELPAGEIFILQMVVWGDMPTKGLLYNDANGIERLMTIQMSGYDGSVFLQEALIK